MKKLNLRAPTWLLLALVSLAGAGCAYVGPAQQRLVSKGDMVFSDAQGFSYDNELFLQVEPGSSFCGGAPSGGCTSCK